MGAVTCCAFVVSVFFTAVAAGPALDVARSESLQTSIAPSTSTSTTADVASSSRATPWWRREHLLPAPASVTLGSGRLRLRKGGLKLASVGLQSSIVDATLARLPPLLFGASVAQCRLPPCNATRACNASSELGELHEVQVNVTQTGGNWSGLAHGSDESYRLEVSSGGVASVVAPTASGAVHGLETLAQLVKISFDGLSLSLSLSLSVSLSLSLSDCVSLTVQGWLPFAPRRL